MNDMSNKPKRTASNVKEVGCKSMLAEPCKIRGVHRYSFRSGEWALITGVKIVTPKGLEPRAAFECMYEDGFVDHIPISDANDYEISS